MSWWRVHFLGSTAFLSIGDGIGFGGDVSELQREIDRAERVELSINSHGGCTFAAKSLVEALKGRCPLATISTVAASSAAFISLVADHVRIVPSGRIMLHPPSGYVFGKSDELRKEAARVDRIADEWAEWVRERTKAPIAQVVQWFAGPDVWFDAEAAVAEKLCDSIFAPPALPLSAKYEPSEDDDDSEAAPTAAIAAKDGTDLFFRLLAAHGPVETGDPQKFLRELLSWGKMNVKIL